MSWKNRTIPNPVSRAIHHLTSLVAGELFLRHAKGHGNQYGSAHSDPTPNRREAAF